MLGLRSSIRRHVALSFVRALRTRSAPTISSRPPSIPSSPADEETETWKRKQERHGKIGMYGVFAGTLVLGFYCSQLAVAVYRASNDDAIVDVALQKDVAGRYDEIADSFDSDVYISEWLMGILTHRKKITKMCSGNVLEVSCGTGRNLGYFDLDKLDRTITSLTLLDLSPQMVQVCKRKFMALRATRTAKKAMPLPVRFTSASGLEDMPLAPDGKKYDTILQTMGLCSTPAPVDLVINMARHLDLDNPDARILLLEHGRSHYGWLNKVMDSSARKHAEKYGCWYNRELDDILNEAATQTGFEVVKAQRFDFGTTYFYELKAGPHAAEKLKTLTAASEETGSGQPTSWRRFIGWRG